MLLPLQGLEKRGGRPYPLSMLNKPAALEGPAPLTLEATVKREGLEDISATELVWELERRGHRVIIDDDGDYTAKTWLSIFVTGVIVFIFSRFF